MYHLQPLHLSPEQVEALLAVSRTLDLAPGPNGSRMSDYTETTAIFRGATFNPLPGRIQLATFVALYPSSQIVAHCDPPIQGRRHHFPLLLNPHSWVFHAGEWQQLEIGRVYQMDPSELHGAVNWGDSMRLHLILDVL